MAAPSKLEKLKFGPVNAWQINPPGLLRTVYINLNTQFSRRGDSFVLTILRK